MSKQQKTRLTCILIGGCILFVLGCASENNGRTKKDDSKAVAKTGPGFFADRASTAGLDVVYDNGMKAKKFSILETLGGGVGLLDYDQDGLLDLFFTQGGYFNGPDKKLIKGHPSHLYRNLGNWKFQDVTAKVGLDKPLHFTHGCAVADYDNDGFPDLVVTGYGRISLYHNVKCGNNGRKFEEVTEKAGLTSKRWSTSAAWADINGDSLPDLYLCHYVNWSFANNPRCKDYRDGTKRDVCPPRDFDGLPDVLYLNNGDGTFRDGSAEAGLRKDGKGLGVLVVDVNDDGLPDIYVANDTTDNFLYLNEGKGKLKECGADFGVACGDNGVPNGSMGVDAAAYDGSGWFSIFVTNYQHEAHALYRNTRKGLFVFSSRYAGITSIGLIYVGFGTCFLDYDHDGDEDIFISNGHVVHRPPLPGKVKQEPILFENQRRPGQKPHEVRFANISKQAGPYFHGAFLGRGMAFGDLDNDGRLDMVVSHVNVQPALLENQLRNGNHWLGIELEGKTYRDAVGAKVVLEVGGEKLVRAVKGGGSFLSACDRRIVFGLGKHAKIGTLTVRWPSGRTQTWQGLAIDRYWRLVEGQRQAARIYAK